MSDAYIPRIKICGLTRPADVDAAAELGADLFGFIHVPASKRYVDAPGLADLLPRVPRHARRVIVVQDAAAATLEGLRETLDFDDFQFHGSETPATVARYGGIKVIHVRDGALHPEPSNYGTQQGNTYLLDTQTEARRGGTGRRFDWSVLKRAEFGPAIPGGKAARLIVAGGLTPSNVADLIYTYRPWAVDVSSGVEAAPGEKDPAKMADFIENARKAVSP